QPEREVPELRRANDILKSSFSSRRSSTVDRRGSRIHRRPPGHELRWAAMGGRADLRGAGDRPFYLLRRQVPPTVGARRARCRAAPEAAGAVAAQLLRVRPAEADQGREEGRGRGRPGTGGPGGWARG